MSKTFEIALPTLCQSPAKPIQELNCCSVFDLYMARQWSRNIMPQEHTTIPQQFSRQVRATPNATAIEAHDGFMTYVKLEETASVLAQLLVEAQVPPLSCILIYFRRGLWPYVCMLAVMKAGCCYAAMDSIHPVEHVVETVRAADIQVVMTEEEYPAELEAAFRLVIPISLRGVASLATLASLTPVVQPDQICFIIFTTGSWGTRKSIRQQHASFCTSLIDFGNRLSINPTTRILCSGDLSSAISNAEVFSALTCGAVACVPSDISLSTGCEMAINHFSATLFINRPTSLSRLMPASVPTLRTFCSLGKVPSQQFISRWSSATVRLGIIYGLPECSIWIGFLDSVNSQTPTSMPVSRVASGALYLMNPNNPDLLVPVGAVGTFVFEGSIAAGHLDTNSPFQADFLEPNPGWLEKLHGPNRFLESRVYRSEYLASCNFDGTFKFISHMNRKLKSDGVYVSEEDVEMLARPCVGEGDLLNVEVLRRQGELPCFAIFLQATGGEMGAVEGGDCVRLRDCKNPEVVRKLKAIETRLEEFVSIQNVVKAFFAVRGTRTTAASRRINQKTLKGLVGRMRRKEEWIGNGQW